MLKEGGQGQVKLGTLEKLLDPFAGGGSIPLEAQRLGLEGVYELVVQDEVMAMKPELIIGAIQDGDAQS